MPGACLHGPPTAKNPHGENKVRYQYNPESVVKLQREARAKSKLPSEKVGYPDKDTRFAFVHLSGILPCFTMLIIHFACVDRCRKPTELERGGFVLLRCC